MLLVRLLIVCYEALQCLGREIHSRFDRPELDVFLTLCDDFCILARQTRQYSISIIDGERRKAYILGQPGAISISHRVFQVQFLVNIQSEIFGDGMVLGESVPCLVKVTNQLIICCGTSLPVGCALSKGRLQRFPPDPVTSPVDKTLEIKQNRWATPTDVSRAS